MPVPSPAPIPVIEALALALTWILPMVDATAAGAWEWLKSPGFAGTAAVVAAIVAYSAARKDRRQKERAERKAQWWRRAEWALNRVTDRDDFTARIGLNVLDALEERKPEMSSAAVPRLATIAEPQATTATPAARPGVSHATRIAAARARRTADVKRGFATPLWILQLAASAD